MITSVDNVRDDLPLWYDMDLVKTLPLPHRLYAWWIKYGIKRKNRLVYGGNRLFFLMRRFYKQFPRGENNFVVVPTYDHRIAMAIDLLDFEVPHHTLPLSAGINSEAKLLKMLFPVGGVFFDVGANYGFFSLMAASLGGELSVVCAFEPQPRLITALKMSKQKNQFDSLHIYELALGQRQGEVDFYIPQTGSGIGSLLRDHANQFGSVSRTRISLATLDGIFSKEGLRRFDLMKIDVEGAEIDVLKGGKHTISQYHPYIWFEMNPSAQERAGYHQEDIYSLLDSLGYCEYYDINTLMQGVKKPIRSVKCLTNVLAVPANKVEFFQQTILA